MDFIEFVTSFLEHGLMCLFWCYMYDKYKHLFMNEIAGGKNGVKDQRWK